MEIVTWFGKIDQETGDLLGGGDADSRIECSWADSMFPAVPVLQPDLRRIALIHAHYGK